MSYLIAAPEMVAGTAEDLAGIGSALRAADGAAALSTTNLTVAAQDEASAGIAGVFGSYGQA